MTLSDLRTHLNNHHIELVHVVAFDTQQAIGKNNQLAWHIPEDLQHFKALTTGGVVVMGRKTFVSMGRPLPNRTNWVITRDTTWTAKGVKVAHNLTDALIGAAADVLAMGGHTLFVIGGGELYAQTIDIADRLELTRINLTIDGDAFYPAIPKEFVCQTRHTHLSKNGIEFATESYQKMWVQSPIKRHLIIFMAVLYTFGAKILAKYAKMFHNSQKNCLLYF